MTPDEKADKATRILELVDGNVRHAFKLKAYFYRAAYYDDVKSYFNQTKAAPGYNHIVDALYFELIMTLVRLFDDFPDKKHTDNTASLPKLVRLLSQAQVRAVLQDRSRQRKTPTGKLGQDSQSRDRDSLQGLQAKATVRAQQETTEIVSLVTDFQNLKGSHLVGRLSRVRNELFAHTALERNRNNPAMYGDAEDLLDQTANFTARLNAAIRSLHCDYTEHVTTWTEQADAFWQLVLLTKGDEPTTESNATLG